MSVEVDGQRHGTEVVAIAIANADTAAAVAVERRRQDLQDSKLACIFLHVYFCIAWVVPVLLVQVLGIPPFKLDPF